MLVDKPPKARLSVGRGFVATRFDAGIGFGEYIEKDMIVVRVPPDLRPAIVSPGCLKPQGEAKNAS